MMIKSAKGICQWGCIWDFDLDLDNPKSRWDNSKTTVCRHGTTFDRVDYIIDGVRFLGRDLGPFWVSQNKTWRDFLNSVYFSIPDGKTYLK